MGKAQRTKGAAGEREIVNLLKEYGIPAKRISMMEANAIDKGDIEVGEGPNKDLGSVKRGQHVPKFVYDGLGDCDFLFMRRDKQSWLVTMDLETFLFLMLAKLGKFKVLKEPNN